MSRKQKRALTKEKPSIRAGIEVFIFLEIINEAKVYQRKSKKYCNGILHLNKIQSLKAYRLEGFHVLFKKVEIKNRTMALWSWVCVNARSAKNL